MDRKRPMFVRLQNLLYARLSANFFVSCKPFHGFVEIHIVDLLKMFESPNFQPCWLVGNDVYFT
jgi:hypothetical protein